ncbi:NAD-dependent epimerase/dehydratase family protein [Deinococcus rubellus]|uniref:NAD-dependent epimerase/dehydratase family protein n=1 Tax=Deinococcus rubellus TaxID=1889240 RepID=A0ABY5YIL6_9DEIO|nr:NAD-dependent epimerase/dehydratase family protein [Deinococcus rubellus]UWX64660.1 NAD-dependent epimerase/dehydratase family protein [Deinococcus rubellus]
MNLLVLGGTRFVGRQLVLAALERGHAVTVFTRGQSDDDLPPDVERLRGDRDAGDLSALTELEQAGRTWDACLDVSGYLPRVVASSAKLLKDAVKRYLFISTVSVYADQARPITEDSALAALDNPESEDIHADYGALKVICEERVRAVYGQRATIVRPGLVAGPFDHTHRFTYWAMRAARGGVASSKASADDERGVALAPGDGQDFIQVIDVRDLAAFTVKLLEENIGGTFNAVGEPLVFGAFLDEVSAGVGSQPIWRWVSQTEQERLEATNLWPIYAHREPVLNIQPTRARAVGLALRPLADTARDTLEWAQASGAEGAGPSAEREAELLAQLR